MSSRDSARWGAWPSEEITCKEEGLERERTFLLKNLKPRDEKSSGREAFNILPWMAVNRGGETVDL